MAFTKSFTKQDQIEKCQSCQTTHTLWIFPDCQRKCEVCGNLHYVTLDCDHGLDGLTIDDILSQDDPPRELYMNLQDESLEEVDVDPDAEEAMREWLWDNESSTNTFLSADSVPPSSEDSEYHEYWASGGRSRIPQDNSDWIRQEIREAHEAMLLTDLQELEKKMKEQVDNEQE